jgi:alkanesulfonate monooxygenase SsuD/methylene tetrahydromethanopterin reductase-like flavin-dependent oxidoreductase (luciferase family)
MQAGMPLHVRGRAMSSDTVLRQEIRYSLGYIRSMIDNYSGLYSGENLARDVLRFCDEMTDAGASHPRLQEARRLVEDRCRRLAHDTDRFALRDPAVIAASRAQAMAAIDMLQDVVFEWRKARLTVPSSGRLLRRKSL